MLNVTRLLYSLLIAYIFVHITLARKEEVNVFNTKYGRIRGTVMKSRSNRSFTAFRGIPFAKPPLGDLRFKAPVPPDPWQKVYSATRDANHCIQQNYFFAQDPQIEGSEDCLYLNVYTPKLTSYPWRRGKLLPVMVFIHYGGYFAGSSRSDVLGPEYFLDKDVILVTFNYRLGVLGLLSTYDDAAPGNWAYKDQVAALRWVRDNIFYFGGDNRRITLFGQSAGGGSTHHHILSPMSKGLFQAAIAQSGSALAPWAKPHTVLSAIVAKTQAFFVGCRNDTDSYTMVECLRKVPAKQLVESANLFRFMWSEPLTVFTATIERQTKENPEPFITEDPLDIIKKGEYNKVPWIIGVADGEGILRVAPFVRQHELLQEINDNFEVYLPKMMGLELSVQQHEIEETWSNIKKFYLPGGGINISDPNSITGFVDLYSDRAFLYSSYQSALLHAWKGHKHIWFYKFDYRGKLSYGDLFAATNATVNYDWGASHCDDLLYLFSSPKIFPPLPSEDLQMSKILIELFTTFATYRNPTPGVLIRQNQGWHPITDISGKEDMKNSDLLHLRISGPYGKDNDSAVRLDMVNEFLPNRMRFWEKLPLMENFDGLH